MSVASLLTREKDGVVCTVGELMHCWKLCMLGLEIHLIRRPLDPSRVKR